MIDGLLVRHEPALERSAAVRAVVIGVAVGLGLVAGGWMVCREAGDRVTEFVTGVRPR